MAIQIASGNLLESKAEALVNTVNTVGVMGKGIALQFKRAFPENFREYEAACKRGEVELGRMFVHVTNTIDNPRYIVNFPTKQHWRSRSKIADVKAGLSDLKRVIRRLGIRSIAVPPLGCGNGGLSWADVRPLIERSLGDFVDVDVLVYAPAGPPPPERMPNRTKRPNLTRFGAAVLLAWQRYMDLSMNAGLAIESKLSLIEAQKIAYFLQISGWPLRLRFDRGHYGPYAPALEHFLSSVEGHFIQGYGDGTGGAQAKITLNPAAVNQAATLMANDTDFEAALSRLEWIISGFEFPYGVELLSTVHYIATAGKSAQPITDVISAIAEWSPRKRQLFKPEQTTVAFEHLSDLDLIRS